MPALKDIEDLRAEAFNEEERYMQDRKQGRAAGYLKFLAGLAIVYTLHFAAPILVPLAIAVLSAFALAPLVRLLRRIGLRHGIGAALVVGGVLTVLGYAVSLLADPAMSLLQEAPSYAQKLNDRLHSIGAPMQVLQEASEGVEKISDAAAADQNDDAAPVRIESPGLLDSALSITAQAAAAFVAIVFFVYFCLASGSSITEKAVRLLQDHMDADRVKALARRLQHEISRYLLTITLINIALGVLTSVWLSFMGVDNALLLGTVVAFFNFAPYVGAVGSALVLMLVSVAQFELLSDAVLTVFGFGVLTVLEGQLLTPMIVGRRLELSPYIVFAGIILWGWLWGIPGALMAVPLMVTMRIVCEDLFDLGWVAVLLDRDHEAIQGKA